MMTVRLSAHDFLWLKWSLVGSGSAAMVELYLHAEHSLKFMGITFERVA